MCYKHVVFYTSIVCLLILGGVLQSRAQTATPAPTPTPKTAFGPGFKRWMDVDAFNLVTRYRYIGANNGTVLTNQGQWQLFLKTRLKLDEKARYSVVTVLASGQTITTNFNNLGPGTGKLQTNLYVKQLFFDAKPAREVEFQFGGIAVNNGENSEATGYDNDNYITGERVIIRAPKHVWFDEISATNAFLGDINRPSIFGRLHRLGQSNYHQFLFRKQVTKEVGFSADYTFASGTDTLREAVRIKPKNFFLDLLLIDAYERVSAPKGKGIDILAAKALHWRFTLSGGFASLDRRLTLNADRFPPGKRLYAAGVLTITPELTLTPVVIHGVGRLATPTIPRTRFDLILTWNVLETLRRHHVL